MSKKNKYHGSKPEKGAAARATSPAASVSSSGGTTQTPIMQTAHQRRAKWALEKVEAADNSGVSRKEYKSYASAFPAMIQMNGLGQAAAFYRCRGAEKDAKGIAYRALYNLLSGWLAQPGQPYAGCADLLVGITSRDMRTYMLAEVEAVALLDWVKKFAKTYMED